MARLTKAQARQELLDQGHHYLQAQPGRADRMVANAIAEVLREWQWSWRRVEEGFDDGAVIEGLGRIEQVWREDGRTLEPVSVTNIRDLYGATDSPGAPLQYFLQGNQLRVYPNADGNRVVYFTEARWIAASDGSLLLDAASEDDEMLPPDGCGDLVILAAQIQANRDIQNWEGVSSLREEYGTQLEELLSEDSRDQVDEMKRIRMVDNEY